MVRIVTVYMLKNLGISKSINVPPSRVSNQHNRLKSRAIINESTYPVIRGLSGTVAQSFPFVPDVAVFMMMSVWSYLETSTGIEPRMASTAVVGNQLQYKTYIYYTSKKQFEEVV